MEECCLALDKIFSQEEKEKIKQSPVNSMNSYVRKLNLAPLGMMIRRDWLRLPSGEGEVGSRKMSTLFYLLLEHGAGFNSGPEEDYEMVGIILDNYRNYLLTGEGVESIEDLAIDYWFNFFRCFELPIQREDCEKMMERWKEAKEKESRRHSTWSIISKCNLI